MPDSKKKRIEAGGAIINYGINQWGFCMATIVEKTDEEWKKTLKLSGECPIEVITYVKPPYDQSTRY